MKIKVLILMLLFLVCFSLDPCVHPLCRSSALPSPPPPPPAPASGGLRPGTTNGGHKTKHTVLLELDKPHHCPTSARTTSKDSVSLSAWMNRWIFEGSEVSKYDESNILKRNLFILFPAKSWFKILMPLWYLWAKYEATAWQWLA